MVEKPHTSSGCEWAGVGVESTTLLFPGEVLPPSPSPASTDPMWHQPLSCQLCSINRVKAQHTHTYTHTLTTYEDPAIPNALLVCSGQLCLCQSLVPTAEVTLPKREREQTALMRPHGGLEVHVHMSVSVCLWMYVCKCYSRGAVLVWCTLLSWSTMCVLSHLKVFPLRPFPSHCLCKSVCFF